MKIHGLMLLALAWVAGCLPAGRVAPSEAGGEPQSQDNRPLGLRMIGSKEELAIREGAYDIAWTLGKSVAGDSLCTSTRVLVRDNIKIEATETWPMEGGYWRFVSIWLVPSNQQVYQADWTQKADDCRPRHVCQAQSFPESWDEPYLFRPGPWMKTVLSLIETDVVQKKNEQRMADMEGRYSPVD